MTPPESSQGSLKPCPFCGEIPETDGEGYVCHVPEHDEACKFDNPSIKNWNNAFCWRETERLSKQNEELKKCIAHLEGALEKIAAEDCPMQKEIAEEALRKNHK